MSFRVRVSSTAEQQIETQATWYELQQPGLGVRFLDVVAGHLSLLERNPFAQVRYDNVRCVPLTDFPLMIHLTIDEEKQIVNVHALIHTARNPKSNWNTGNSFVSEPEFIYGPKSTQLK